MKKSTELERLKNRLLKGESEKNQVFNLCRVMEVCGGYEQLMNLPIPALTLILNYLEQMDKNAQKSLPKMSRRKR